MEYEIHELEQIAYGAVLRAFKAQSDALTWEKEGIITELRKELRVSDDEHRELLTEVNADDVIHRIREWREAGGTRNLALIGAQHMSNQLPGTTVMSSRRKQRAFLPGHPGGPHSLHPHSVAASTQPLSSSVKWGPTSGISGRRPNPGQPGFTGAKHMQYQFVDNVSSGAPMDDPSEGIRDPLIGRKVMIRWPADNNFYEAIINDYNPADGRHLLVYDSNTPNASLEWVNMRQIPPEDIRWIDVEPVAPRLGEAGVPNLGTARISSLGLIANETRPAGNGVVHEDIGEIEIYHTDTLIKKVEKVLDASHPDELEIYKAKRLLKEHEQTLIRVIERLGPGFDNSDGGPVHMHG